MEYDGKVMFSVCLFTGGGAPGVPPPTGFNFPTTGGGPGGTPQLGGHPHGYPPTGGATPGVPPNWGGAPGGTPQTGGCPRGLTPPNWGGCPQGYPPPPINLDKNVGQNLGQKMDTVFDKKLDNILDKKLDKYFGNFWRWGVRAVRLLRSRRRTVLFPDVFGCSLMSMVTL